jgi:hypothetical protein
MAVSITPDRDHEQMFHEWYETVHVPEVLVCPGFLSARRYESLEGIRSFFALYYMEQPEILESAEFRAVSERSPDELPALTQRLAPHMKSNFCDVYRARSRTW